MPPSSPSTVHDLQPGQSGVIQRLSCPRPIARRLMEMGLLPGTRVTLVRVAPLGDPVQLRVRDFGLSVRRAEAAQIEVTEERVPATSFAPVPSYRVG